MGRKSFKRIVPLAVAVLTGIVVIAAADDIPPYLRNVVAPQAMTSPKVVAVRDALALDDQMQVIYSSSQSIYKKNLLATSPVILGLFSNQGGEFYLYLPGKPAIRAPRVPVTYEICKSCGHSAMAVYQLVAPYLANPDDPSWRRPMAQYLALQEAVLAGFAEHRPRRGRQERGDDAAREQHRLHEGVPEDRARSPPRACGSTPSASARPSPAWSSTRPARRRRTG